MKVYHGNVRFSGKTAKVIVAEWEWESAKNQPERIRKDNHEDIYRGVVHAADEKSAQKKLLTMAMKVKS